MSTEPDLHELSAEGIQVVFDASLGMIRDLVVTIDGRTISAYAKAPWRDLPTSDPRFPSDMAPHLARLSTDFFCAPFAVDDIEGAPGHGRTANSRWRFVDRSRSGAIVRARFELEATIAGLSVSKTLLLIDGHPFLYQQHVLAGADVAIPVAHHAMVDASGGVDLSFSPKAFAETPPTPLEPDPSRGRSLLSYPAHVTDLSAFPLADGTQASLLSYPIGQRHEDFVMLVDEQERADPLGWAIAYRRGQDDSAILAKPAARLPQTMLWFSNRGRDYAPWLGEHADVLGIEEACSYSLHGWSASVAPNPLSASGVPTSVSVRRAEPAVISFAMGAGPGAVAYSDGAFRRSGGGAIVPFDRSLVVGDRRFEDLA